MRSSSKSRNRGKNTNRRGYNGGSIINRVFESAGPDGKVRGTPQQIIDKYISLAHDSQLSGDRVSAENFQQHAEHYSRILSEAQKELAEKNIDGLNLNLHNNNRNENANSTTNTSFVDNDNKLVQKNKPSIISEDPVNEKNPNEVCSPSDDLVEKSKQKITKSKNDTSLKNKRDDNRIISEI